MLKSYDNAFANEQAEHDPLESAEVPPVPVMGVKVGEFTKGLQLRFVVWSPSKFGHSPSYISRLLSVFEAACKFATKSTVRETADGRIVETRLLKAMPEICCDIKWISGLTKKPEPQPRDYVPTFE